VPGSESLVPSVPWVARETARLVSLLRALDEEAWRRPSFCPGWTAAHVAGHMAGGAESYAIRIEAAREGRTVIPFGSGDEETFQARRAAIIEEVVASPPEARVARFEESANRLQAALESLRPEDLDRRVWHRRGEIPLRQLPDQRLFEVVLHGWDIRNAPAAPLPPDALGVMARILEYRLPLYFNRSGRMNFSGAFRFETATPAHAWGMDIRENRAAPCPPEGRDFAARLFAPASDMVLLATGRADPAAKERAGALRIEGDRARAGALMGILFRPY